MTGYDRVYSRFLSISFIVQTGIHVVRGAATDVTRSTCSSTKRFSHGAWRDISRHKVAQRSVLVLFIVTRSLSELAAASFALSLRWQNWIRCQGRRSTPALRRLRAEAPLPLSPVYDGRVPLLATAFQRSSSVAVSVEP